MTLIWNIIQSVITILEIRVCVWMMEKFAEPRYSGKKQKIVVWIVTLGVGGFYAINRWTTVYYSRSSILICIIVLSLAVSWLFIYYRMIAVFIAAIYLLLGGLLDLVIMSVLEMLTQSPGLFVYLDCTINLYRMGVMFLSKTLLFVSCWFVQRKIDKTVIFHLTGKTVKIICMILCVTTYIAIHTLTVILNTNAGITQDFLYRLFFYMVTVFSLLAIAVITILYYDKKSQLKLQSVYLDSINYENQRIIKLYREREKLYHDFKNHLLVLDGLIQGENFDAYREYMEEIKQPFIQKPIRWRTGHDVMDLILNYKVGEAEEQRIHVSCHVFGYINFKLEMVDGEVCSLMGNLWDNAIEACKRLEKDEQMWIDFEMHIRLDKILIEIANPCHEIYQDAQGVLQTTKMDKQLHGIGIRTIKNITNRHHGYLNYVLCDHTFKVEVMICNNK